MGDVERRVFDRPKSSNAKSSDTALYRRQLREFVLRYLMRVGDFHRPSAFIPNQGATTQEPGPFSLCPSGAVQHQGFGYSQWFYKLRRTGEIGRFPEGRRFAIIDLREIGETYEWIVVRVKIFNFTVQVQPFGDDAPQVVIPLEES